MYNLLLGPELLFFVFFVETSGATVAQVFGGTADLAC